MKNASKEKLIFGTLKFKVIASFMIPMIFIILLGCISYLKASEAIESKYERAAEESVNMAGECMRLGFHSVQSNAMLYANDSLFQKYALSQDDKAKAWQYRDSIGNVIFSKKAADEFIKNIYLVNKNVDSISTSEGIDSDIFASFRDTDLGKALDNIETEYVWDGEDEYLDKQFKTNPDKDYSMRLIRKIINVDAFIAIDVDAKFVQNILTNLKFDKASFLGLVTPDGKEIIDYSLKQEDPNIDIKALKSEKIFVNQAFYTEAMTGDEEHGSKYVDYKGDTYLFLYSKVGDTGAVLCALIPQSIITSQAVSIRNVIISIVALACIITILIATLLSSSICKAKKREE